MAFNGSMEVYDNVVLQANTAGSDGGAVSSTFEIDSNLSVEELLDSFGNDRFDSVRQLMLVSELLMLRYVCKGWYDSPRQLAKPRREVRWLGTN